VFSLSVDNSSMLLLLPATVLGENEN